MHNITTILFGMTINFPEGGDAKSKCSLAEEVRSLEWHKALPDAVWEKEISSLRFNSEEGGKCTH